MTKFLEVSHAEGTAGLTVAVQRQCPKSRQWSTDAAFGNAEEAVNYERAMSELFDGNRWRIIKLSPHIAGAAP